jgi:hypothetical protein
MKAADEHHRKATGARNRGEPRVTELATRSVCRNSSATGRTVERLGVHRFGMRSIFLKKKTIQRLIAARYL